VGFEGIEEEEEVEAEVKFSLGTSRNCHRFKFADEVPPGRGGFQQSYGPPAQVLGECNRVMRRVSLLIGSEMGTFMHATEGEMVCESINAKIPFFNAPIYLENKVRRCLLHN
jgi:hypothetical protein